MLGNGVVVDLAVGELQMIVVGLLCVLELLLSLCWWWSRGEGGELPTLSQGEQDRHLESTSRSSPSLWLGAVCSLSLGAIESLLDSGPFVVGTGLLKADVLLACNVVWTMLMIVVEL